MSVRSTRGVLTRVQSVLVDVIYPARCASCGRRGSWVCSECDAALQRFVPPWCQRCGAPDGLVTCRCADLSPTLTRLRSVGSYDGWLQSAIVRFKYEEEWARAEHLGTALVDPLAAEGGFDGLVPVPLHPKRERRRGYNQAALLAHVAGRHLGVPVLPALQRMRATPHQVGLGAAERRQNVENAFAGSPGVVVHGLRLVLVDDVTTTGSTLGACAEALLAHGALEVTAVTLAREA